MAIVRYTYDPNKPFRFSPETLARLEAMTEEEIEANALSDPDNPPMTEEEANVLLASDWLAQAREASGVSVERFAAVFRIPPDEFVAFEQGGAPYGALRAYIKVIAREPEAVLRALADRPAASAA